MHLITLQLYTIIISFFKFSFMSFYIERDHIRRNEDEFFDSSKFVPKTFEEDDKKTSPNYMHMETFS